MWRKPIESAAPVGVSELISSVLSIPSTFLNFYSKIPSKKEPLGSCARTADPPQGPPKRPKMAPRRPKMAPRRFKMAKMPYHVGSWPPRWLQMAQDGLQDASKMAQDASKTAQQTPKTPQDEPREAKIIEKPMVFV